MTLKIKCSNKLQFKQDPNRVLSLFIEDCKKLDLDGLQQMQKLQVLSLTRVQCCNLQIIQNLVHLDQFYLEQTIDVVDISFLKQLTRLSRLSLYDSHITDISVLQSLVTLTSLNLTSNQLSNISSLSYLVNLDVLYLQDNAIEQLEPIKNLFNLKQLNLNQNKVSNINCLSGLVNLRVLELNSNNLTDVFSLYALTNLQQLYLQNNSIVDITFLQFNQNLLRLDLSFNQIFFPDSLQKLHLTSLNVTNNAVDLNLNPFLENQTPQNAVWNKINVEREFGVKIKTVNQLKSIQIKFQRRKGMKNQQNVFKVKKLLIQLKEQHETFVDVVQEIIGQIQWVSQ
ncbi:leucine-rich_repeat domain-containing protein [Hexamita inflata]|uniref:Leucine-rich_repeat domain-containing protein n=1 Tax=Hexamita inflata TaxID=28002 RepID=A0ABP1H8N2_9EUKA